MFVGCDVVSILVLDGLMFILKVSGADLKSLFVLQVSILVLDGLMFIHYEIELEGGDYE